MWLQVDTLTDVQRAAIVECLRVFARRGRAIREGHASTENENRAAERRHARDFRRNDSTPHERASVYGEL